MDDPKARQPSVFARALRFERIIRRTVARTLEVSKVMKSGGGRLEVFEVTRNWAQDMNALVGIKSVEIKGTPLTSEPCLYVANHLSYLDITQMMALVPITFIAKKEIARWPIFGAGTTAAGTVYIDRSSARSRASVSQIMGNAISKEGKSIGIFPQGTSTMEIGHWKVGAFNVAKEFGFKVQAVRIHYTPLRAAAFIGDDALLPHLWNLLGVENIEASLEFFDPIVVKTPKEDAHAMEEAVRKSFKKKVEDSTPDDL